MSRMKDEMNINASDMLKALDNTEISIFLYYPQERRAVMPKKLCSHFQCDAVYYNMPYTYAESHVHPDDRDQYLDMYARIHNGEKTASSMFRNQNPNAFIKDTLTAIAWDEKGMPTIVLGVVFDATDSYRNSKLVEQLQKKLESGNKSDEMAEVVKAIASSIGGQYYAIYHIWLESRTYICFHEKLPGILSDIGEKGDYEQAWKIYINDYIAPEDQESMQKFSDISTLSERLKNRNSISHNYRRIGAGWTRGAFIVGTRDKKGDAISVIYSVVDINSEVELEERQKKAVFEAEHDPMTGVYNRKGFDRILASKEIEKEKIGFLIVDIDNFKVLNDSFGHAMGDQVLIAVAEQLSTVFYHDDIVARIGGDEFAVLLRNCDLTSWNKVCLKLHTIHVNLTHCFPKTMSLSVTISCGLSFSENGYTKQLFKFSDEGLYETKRLGRAGCTLISNNHQVLEHWSDKQLSELAKNVLEYNNSGTCQIEIPNNSKKPRRFICGETEKAIMAIPKDATPEEIYVFWYNRIDPNYIELLKRVEKSMIEYGQTECVYLWNHPEYGKIFVRSGGYGRSQKGKATLIGYFHSLRGTRIVLHQDDKSRVLNTLNETLLSSYYLDFEKNNVTSFDSNLDHKIQTNFNQNIADFFHDFIINKVDPQDQKSLQEFFNIENLQSRLGQKFFLEADYRNIESLSWSRVRLLPVGYDKNGKLSQVLLTITIMSSDKLERYGQEYNQRNLATLFDNLPCGIVMYEWDGKSIKEVHVSKYYKEHFCHLFIKADEQGCIRLNFDCIHPEDVVSCKEAIKKAFNETLQLHHEFRVWNEKMQSYVFERIDAVISVDQKNNKLIYAIYTDLTKQKEQELRLKKNKATLLASLEATNQLCYEYDPIQHTIDCLTDFNFLKLPMHMDNYPNSLKGTGIIHPEDEDMFINVVHQLDEEIKRVQCDVRLKKNEDYVWYSCTFNDYYDLEKKRHVAILNIVDDSLRMDTLKVYEDRLHSLVSITENTLCMSLLNLSKNTYEIIECKDSIKSIIDNSLPLDKFMLNAAKGIVGEESLSNYKQCFNPEYLLQQAEKGNMHVEMKYILRLNSKQYEWVLSAVDLVRNPLNGEVKGTAYTVSIQSEKMNQFLLEKTLEQDYLFVAVIFVATDEFYLYNPSKGKYSKRMQNYWDIALSGSVGHCSEKTYNELQKNITKKNILECLEKNREYRYAYDGNIGSQFHRLEINFCYADAEHTMIMAAMRNITDSELLRRYRHDSEHDFLTDLYNRKTVIQNCKELLNRYPNDQFVMLHADIKHFRLYNTFFGDAAGDKLLCEIAKLFRSIEKDYSYWTYGRINADVFAAFFPYNKELYEKQITKLITELKNYRSDFLIEPAIGLYFVTDRDMSIEAMFTRATLAAKMVQPDTPYATVVFDETMERTLKDDQNILSEMQAAIDEEQFHIYLQPKYSLRTQKIVGAEALVRWLHPERGIVPPNRFIPLFENNGFISTLDRYMWEHTCQLLNKWKKSGRVLQPISVNVSRISAYSQDMVPFLKGLVEKYDIDPKYLELELTESAYVEDQEKISSRLIDLQNYGFKILMDDFGSGYSSLNTLKDLPIDILKLDMKFLSFSDTGRGRKILSSIIRMSKFLKIPVIAEGVENEMQASYLRSIGCEYVQGYLYARPMSIADYEKTILDTKENIAEDKIEQSKSAIIIDKLLHTTNEMMIIDDELAIPIALIDKNEDTIYCLRANRAFIYNFGISDDLHYASELIKSHLSIIDYDRMLRALQKCIEIRKPIDFKINWKNEDGTIRTYRVNAIYEGAISDENIFATTFIEEKELDFFE